ncbi:LOW QUALITY PROTEIN: hypothetical protein BDA96_02G356800 [Sorghum bicolor]|uniref:Uncharacterized protein n=2 Tax=Sorghum bicolor TaxID=4558 RepID=A0A921UUR5_SORBI|nr:LOW QUALITY PROTEIN: hypothetical protein BDA96_02G356800 [Sorghum bicolor]OQU90105.1 LOW QUALITY PROTEIN: hypothetical protein SORBI_3002G340350 [Sorghum bicolor]
MPRLKSPTILLPSPPPPHNCRLLAAARRPLLTSLSPASLHYPLLASLARSRPALLPPAGCRSIYTYKRAPRTRKKNSGCWIGECAIQLAGRGSQQPGGASGRAMVFFCFLVDQRRKVRSSKPAAGICSRCGGCASVADMETATRVCYLLTVHRRTWRAIICTFCGAMLKSYRHYRLY